MKKIILICSIFILIFIAGCTNKPIACTAEAKICPDGSSVGRTGPNCDFAQCSNSTGIANPASTNCIEKGGTLEIVNEANGQVGICTLSDGTKCEEWAYFRGECGANATTCTYDNSTYIKKAPCVINFLCIRGKEAFSDNCGCGCRDAAPQNATTPPNTTDKATQCTDPRPEVCTLEYSPVCGFFNQSIQCIKYPCAATYGNKCQACGDQKVAYWEQGECPI